MQNDIEQQPKTGGQGKVVAGVILLVCGGVLLLQQIGGYFLPWWLFQWPMILIIIGLYSGARHNFRRPGAYMFIIIGTVFLLNDIFPGVNFAGLFWPVIIISVGAMMILGRNNKWDRSRFKRDHRWNHNRNTDKHWDWDKQVNPDDPNAPMPGDSTTGSSTSSSSFSNPANASEDMVDATSIFGSANKTIFSKNFKGGEIVNVFGGAEIDFTQADINGRVVIDVTQIFGGIKLLVPPHWHVTSDMVALFAGFDDKRKQKINLDSGKVLVITGTSIFAGIEIRSY